MGMKDEIVNFLAGVDGGRTHNEIATAIKRPVPSVRRTVRELEQAGRVWEAFDMNSRLTFTTTPAAN